VRKVNAERLGRLEPAAKVNMAVEMTEAMVSVCVEGIKAQNPNMTEEELMERLRERLEWAKRSQRGDGRVK
jgi:hypothetical protein